jgi:hypothetical protein
MRSQVVKGTIFAAFLSIQLKMRIGNKVMKALRIVQNKQTELKTGIREKTTEGKWILGVNQYPL